jgi:holo-[acyl-carrier protein] synthase
MKNIGIDLIENSKILEIGINEISERIFSKKEHEIFNKIKNLKIKINFIAGRWAGKKAIFKAFQKGNMKNNYKDWSILNDSNFGFPYVEHTSNCNNYNIMISITHSKNYSLAFVILL